MNEESNPVAGQPSSTAHRPYFADGWDRVVKAALFGFPLGHSVSPAMHHAAAAALGLALRYEPRQVSAEELGDALRIVRGDDWVGANVTLPHKPAAATMVNHLTPLAAQIGAVNTIFKRDGALWGENTDAPLSCGV